MTGLQSAEEQAITRYLTADHARLAALLARAESGAGAIDADAYDAFRRGLLRHIGMEEKILLPAAQRARGGAPLPAAARLRLDHGALAALLVPAPTRPILAAIRTTLADHDRVEEGPNGVYDACERAAVGEGAALLARLQAAPEVPVAVNVDDPRVMDAMRRALVRAGYDPERLGIRRED